MKFLILLCLVGAAYCSPTTCNSYMSTDQHTLVVDGQVNDMGQIDCVHNMIKSMGDKIREVRLNIGDHDHYTTTKTTMKGDWFKKMMTVLDQDDHIEFMDLHIYNVDMDDTMGDLTCDHIRSIRIHLHTESDSKMMEQMFEHSKFKTLERFTMFTNTETEPKGTLKFIVDNLDHMRHIRINSYISDYEIDRDTFYIKHKDMHTTLPTKTIGELKTIGEHMCELSHFRDVWIFCGNDVTDFDYVFKGNYDLRKVNTNMDMTKLPFDNFTKVWLSVFHDVDVSKENLKTWSKQFPNTHLFSIHQKSSEYLTKDQKVDIKTIFKHVDRAEECKMF